MQDSYFVIGNKFNKERVKKSVNQLYHTSITYMTKTYSLTFKEPQSLSRERNCYSQDEPTIEQRKK